MEITVSEAASWPRSLPHVVTGAPQMKQMLLASLQPGQPVSLSVKVRRGENGLGSFIAGPGHDTNARRSQRVGNTVVIDDMSLADLEVHLSAAASTTGAAVHAAQNIEARPGQVAPPPPLENALPGPAPPARASGTDAAPAAPPPAAPGARRAEGASADVDEAEPSGPFSSAEERRAFVRRLAGAAQPSALARALYSNFVAKSLVPLRRPTPTPRGRRQRTDSLGGVSVTSVESAQVFDGGSESEEDGNEEADVDVVDVADVAAGGGGEDEGDGRANGGWAGARSRSRLAPTHTTAAPVAAPATRSRCATELATGDTFERGMLSPTGAMGAAAEDFELPASAVVVHRERTGRASCGGEHGDGWRSRYRHLTMWELRVREEALALTAAQPVPRSNSDDNTLRCGPGGSCGERRQRLRLGVHSRPAPQGGNREQLARGTQRGALGSQPAPARPERDRAWCAAPCPLRPTHRPSRASSQFGPLALLDYWLDAIMAGVPEVAICFHSQGVVQSYDLVKTDVRGWCGVGCCGVVWGGLGWGSAGRGVAVGLGCGPGAVRSAFPQ